MKTTLKAASAAVLATGLGLGAAAPANAVEIGEISNATRIANGAAVQGTFTVTCTAGTTVVVGLNLSQAVDDGDIASGGDYEQWACAGGEVEMTYDVVAFTKAFQTGPAVVTGFIQECQANTCDTGTNLPLIVIVIEDQATTG